MRLPMTVTTQDRWWLHGWVDGRGSEKQGPTRDHAVSVRLVRGPVRGSKRWQQLRGRRAQQGDSAGRQGEAGPPASVMAPAWEPPPPRRRLLSSVWTLAARTAVGILAAWASAQAAVRCSMLVTGRGRRWAPMLYLRVRVV